MPYDWSCKPTYRWLWRGKNKYYNINKQATGRKLTANREHHTRRFWEWSRSTTQEDGTFNNKEALPSVVYNLPTIIARIAPKRWKHYWLFAMTEANWVEREQIRTCCRPVCRNASKSTDSFAVQAILQITVQSLLNTMSKFLYCYTCMSEVAFGALLSCTNIVNALPKEVMKALIWIFLICWPGFLDVTLQLGKEFLNGIKIWWVRRQVQ